ncbi:sigma-54 dependent transcriptional regulator [Geomonas sp. Red32]|uniref:sigma-54-dependent transcriptional regulator n=1 Tax=Geomonas sp. Red32 TaxID=2912856 RepID=UPI00202CC7C7|nr:sigma-54 dependent transcriptional regulator [Geomonas sp. Red32]MCM0081442.1 sigma-54 dependent transcriptional regulator [Geomonas sp. Red32]
MKRKILLLDDDAGTRFGFTRFLSLSGYDVQEAESLTRASAAYGAQKFDAVIVDLNLPDGSGLDFIETVRSDSPDVPIIVITGAGDIPLAVEAMRRGADNFLTKPVDMEGIELFLEKSLEIGMIRKGISSRQRIEKVRDPYFGESPAMKEAAEIARLAAGEDSPVLITGETGTGKGVLAAWIHRQSRRRTGPFVELNCSLLRGELLASELFGHVRGAFTSADRDREGFFDAADGGTLVLDEIGEMEIPMQAQFLKVLEEKSFRRLGETKVRRSDFRLICATNKDIEEEVRAGRFRRDLFFRINLLTIWIPPLRERVEDIPGLTRHMLGVLGAPEREVSAEILEMLTAYPWPGNVRELRNVLERGVILSRGKPFTPQHFATLRDTSMWAEVAGKATLEEVEKAHLLAVLERCGGDVAKAATELGISKATVYRRLKELKKPSGTG